MDQMVPQASDPGERVRGKRTTTKALLVDEVSRIAGLTRKQGDVVVETIFDGIIAALREGEKIELRGFGSFKVRERGARLARNPKQSGVKVSVPPKRVPYFKPGKKLKELLNGIESGAGSKEEKAG